MTTMTTTLSRSLRAFAAGTVLSLAGAAAAMAADQPAEPSASPQTEHYQIPRQ